MAKELSGNKISEVKESPTGSVGAFRTFVCRLSDKFPCFIIALAVAGKPTFNFPDRSHFLVLNHIKTVPLRPH
jgi:hypothetical protein